jgi:hypothetical protein
MRDRYIKVLMTKLYIHIRGVCEGTLNYESECILLNIQTAVKYKHNINVIKKFGGKDNMKYDVILT